jgi:histidinol-phosphate aminotransferase
MTYVEEKYKGEITSLVRPEVLELPPYGAGQTLSQAEEKWPDVAMVNLSVNENPFGISESAKCAINEVVSESARYPDSQCSGLRLALAKQLSTSEQRLIIGNGSEDILALLCKAFLKPSDEVLIAKPSFSLHSIYVNMMSANVIAVPMNDNMQYDNDLWLSQILKLPKLKMLMLANPSNPVGCSLDGQSLTAYISSCPEDTLIVIDEAYFEFAQDNEAFADSLSILSAQSRPWIILRTFSKAYGLAGLRVGYGLVSDSKIIDYLDRVRTPYNVNSTAQAAATAVLNDENYLEKTVNLIKQERERIVPLLESLGLFVAPSLANFLFINTMKNANDVARELLAHGIMVKPWNEANYESYIRMTIGLVDENNRFVQALQKVLEL